MNSFTVSKDWQNWNVYTILLKVKKKQFYKDFPFCFCLLISNQLKKKLENIVLNNFRPTDNPNVTEINFLVNFDSKKRINLKQKSLTKLVRDYHFKIKLGFY